MLVLGVAVLLCVVPVHPAIDDWRRQRALDAFLHGPGSGKVMKYSVVMPLVALGPYWLARALGIGSLVYGHFDILLWVPWSLFVGTRLTRLRGRRFAVAVVTLTTISMFAPFVTVFNAEAFSLMFVSAGLLVALDARGRASRGLGIALVAIGVANIPVQILAAFVAGAYLWWRRREAWLLLAAVAAFVFQVGDVWWTTGGLGVQKYPEEWWESPLLPWGRVVGFGYPFLFGLVGILVSLGRGIVWFQPGLFVHTPANPADAGDTVRTWRVLMTVMIVAMIPVYARWWAWYGGFTFGPRFFLLGVVPAAVALCERLANAQRSGQWVVGAVLTLLSGWVAIVAVLYFATPRADFLCRTEDFRYEPLCWWVGEYSPLLAPTWDRATLTPAGVVFALVAAAAVTGVVVLLTPRGRWHDLRGWATAPLRRLP